MTRPARIGRYEVDPLPGAIADFTWWARKARKAEDRATALEFADRTGHALIERQRIRLAIPAIQRRRTIRYNWIRFTVDLRVMQANLKQTISGPAPASYGNPPPVVVTSPPKNDEIAALEPAPAGSRVGGAG